MNPPTLKRIPRKPRDRCICGREFIMLERNVEQLRTLMGCPRFPRSWRNLWAGGIRHSALAYYDGIAGASVVRWL